MTTLHSRHAFGPRLHVEKHVLPNGLGVLLLPDHSAPVLAYQTWYRVGSRHEQPGRTGIAHLFEHLMFNQTEHLPAGELDRLMEAAGGETNAATWVDWTYYKDSLPAAELELAARVEADRMHYLTLEDTQVESEREVVANERRQRVDDDVDGFLAEQLFATAFQSHPYHHPTIGWMDDIMAITTEDARAFYRRSYAPDNATVVLVGDFAADDALRVLEEQYGKIPRSGVSDAAPPAEPPQASERRARFPRPVVAERVMFGYKIPGHAHEDWPAVHALSEVLTGGPSARLYRELVVAGEAATAVQSMATPWRDPGLLELSVTMKRGRTAAEAEEALDRQASLLGAEPVTADELAKIKNRLETELWMELETVDGKAEQLGMFESTRGDYRELFGLARRLEELTAEDLQRAARRYLVPTGRTVVVAEPSGEPVDEEDEGGES